MEISSITSPLLTFFRITPFYPFTKIIKNNIWVALDRGLAYIRYTDGLSYYRSTDGGFGGIYDATIWHDNLLIGTNQGIYYTRHDKLNDLDMFFFPQIDRGHSGAGMVLP